MSHSYYPSVINQENTNYNNLCLILTDSPLLSGFWSVYVQCVHICVCVRTSVTFFPCCCLNRQSLRYSLQNSAHAILITHQNMEAGAPTPSLTLYIIDYARLQISLEKDTERHKARKRAGEREREKGGCGEKTKS